MDILLKIFASDFTKSTEIKCEPYEDRTFPHWKRLIIRKHQINCEDMEKISEFIREKFSQKGKFSHLLVTLHQFDGGLCITADVSQLERVYKKI